MPICAVIEDKIICMHGGLSPDFNKVEKILSITRPTEIPESGLLSDLLWSDPVKEMQGWADSERGIGYLFGVDVVTNFLKVNELDLVCRAHQVV